MKPGETGTTLSGMFLSAAAPPVRAALERSPRLDGRVEEIVRDGAAAWPGCPAPAEWVVEQLGRNLRGPAAAEVALDAIRAADLHLAAACAAGDAGACAVFEREVLAPVRGWLVRARHLSADAAGEVIQRARERLLVGKRRRIADYSGRGSLLAWVRAVAVRIACDLDREEQRCHPGGAGDLDEGHEGYEAWFPHDPELSFIRAQHQADFREAFREALAALDSRERALLKLHHLDGLSVESVGAVFQAPRSTAASWIARARQRLLELTRERLKARLRLRDDELESFWKLVRSQLEITLSRLIG